MAMNGLKAIAEGWNKAERLMRYMLMLRCEKGRCCR
jgi:hypothetical protein